MFHRPRKNQERGVEKTWQAVNIQSVMKAMPHLLKLPSKSFWIDYDDG